MIETIKHINSRTSCVVDYVRFTEVPPNLAGLKDDVTWLVHPTNGQTLVKKQTRLGEEFEYSAGDIKTEQAALVALQPYFEKSDSRAVRILGYGEEPGPLRHKLLYLLLEPIDTPFISLRSLLKKEKILSLGDTLNFTREVVSVLEQSHSLSITHGDLNEDGAEDHVFIDPATGKVRIIDWGISQFNGDYQEDIEAIGEMIFRSLTGRFTIESRWLKNALDTMNPQIRDILRRTGRITYEEPNSESIDRYHSTPEGIKELSRDLLRVKI